MICCQLGVYSCMRRLSNNKVPVTCINFSFRKLRELEVETQFLVTCSASRNPNKNFLTSIKQTQNREILQ